MLFKNICLIASATLIITGCGGGGGSTSSTTTINNSSSNTNLSTSFNLQNMFVKNYDFDTVITAIASGDKTPWHNEQRIKNTEFVNNGILTTKMEDKDISNTGTETEHFWYEGTGVLLKMTEGTKTCEIGTGVIYSSMPNNALIGDTGSLPNLLCTDATSIKINWSLENINNKATFKTETKYYSSLNVINEVIDTYYTIDNNGKLYTLYQNFFFGDRSIALIKTKEANIVYK